MARRSLDIYLIAIGGTGMAPLACLLQEQGHRVRGSDGPLYPPMSDLLAAAGIEPLLGPDPANLEPRPELVIVGNVVRRDQPETVAAAELGIEQISMPQALARFFLAGRRPLVAAGTHGKTTTSSLAAWVWADCGRDPGYLIGGIPTDLGKSFAAGSGERFVIEGDEYGAAYFDRRPKFLHYRPETAILTSVEYDHADLYATPAELVAAYESLVEIVPPEGRLIACGDSEDVRRVASKARAEVIFYGLEPGNDLHPVGDVQLVGGGSRFVVDDPEAGPTEVRLTLTGRHNVTNALAVWAAARRDGLPATEVARALGRFHGVKRRQEELGTAAGVTVVDDFAHHPTAVDETLQALRARYRGRRLVAVFEPRSNTAGRRIFHDDYRRAFARGDRIWVAPVFHRKRLSDEERLDFELLARELTAAGKPAAQAASNEELLEELVKASRDGDVVVMMSSGSFDGLPRRLLERLRG